MRSLLVLSAAGVVAAASHAGGFVDPVGPHLPWGIHIAYGSDPSTEMTVMWSTRSSVASTVVQYGVGTSLAQTAVGNATTFDGQQAGQTPQQLHLVALSGLQPATLYSYTVGDGAGNTSAVFNFTTSPGAGAFDVAFQVYGDMGISSNAQDTMPWLIQDIDSGLVDVVLHIGDLAYNLESNNGATGDAFMVQIEPIAARVPYHTCPGNHEADDDMFQYRMRMGAAMPLARNTPSAGGGGIFHSFDVGRVHVVMVSSEVYFSVQPHTAGLMAEQWNWLDKDLAAVDRSVTPYVILGLHQPFYCSPNDDNDDCHSLVSLVRDGVMGEYGLEQLLYKYGVDLVFGAHEHAYERNYPVYQLSWNSSRTGPAAYINYDRTIHILTGAAGCPEDEDGWQATGNPWSAVRINDYGYIRLFTNATAMKLQYVDNQKGAVLDEVVLQRDAYGPFNTTATAATA